MNAGFAARTGYLGTEVRLDERRLSYLPGLDGLRALAVTAVLLYHSGQSWIPGGFLGVEVFFVISGYLITCVLMAGREETGRVNVREFWFRRARRLLPALFLLLLGAVGVAVLFYREEVTELRVDTLAALGYVTNWYFILDHASYFEFIGRPPLLQHLWSLAIEEQFYLVWPLVVVLLAGRLRRRGMFVLSISGAVASTVLMAGLWSAEADPSRVYFGTDTRAAGLLIGAALAFVWTPSLLRHPPHRAYTVALDGAGLIALGSLVYLHLELDQYAEFLYRGGFALVAVSTALLVAIIVHPHAHIGGVLGLGPLRWLGTRSYAVYLWHWPVFVLTRPDVDVALDGTELLVLRLAITFALAELSYRLIERPVRSGALGRAWRAFRDAQGRARWSAGARLGTPVGIAATSTAVLGVFAIAAQTPAPPPYLAVEAVRIVSPADPAHGAERVIFNVSPTNGAATPTPGPVPNDGVSSSAPQGPAREPAPGYAPASGVAVTAVGDSVMVGAAPELARAIPGADVDAAIGRQAPAVIDIVQQRSAAGALGDAVVIHVGNNGVFKSNQFDAMMQALADRRVVIFVNVKIPRDWEGPNNDVIAAGVARYGNAALVDWHGASVDRPELFYDDGIHLRRAGVELYTSLITHELAKHPPPTPTPEPTETPPPPVETPPPPFETPPPVETPPPTPEPTPEPTAPPTPEPTPEATPEPTPVDTPQPSG
ncbi:MAG TPA: acyltransferase family protein [Dehalococcoidia bacterium]|nr:acyltransferase family protein [Dehalococcoidia bacterium]